MIAIERRKEMAEKLQTIIKCENARLNFHYWERKELEEKIDPSEKEMATKLLTNLKLDTMEY